MNTVFHQIYSRIYSVIDSCFFWKIGAFVVPDVVPALEG